MRRLEEGSTISADIFASTLRLQQRFSEGYHQKLEEDHVFSKMEVAGKLTELTQVLRVQHDAERKLTAQLLKNATPSGLGSSERRTALVEGLRSLNRMLRPHTAWEDTVLFPAFHQLFTEREFEKLGEVFAQTEHQALGPAGFQGILGEVVQLEKGLGIDKLSSFTIRI
jgi:hemerythrin-like domain-containing protein